MKTRKARARRRAGGPAERGACIAFTLIELLIVVAIIAILAAIAVPNFLEAQTRAKVARTRSDLRTMFVGLECYRIDNNAYPSGESNGTVKWLAWITTPVAYLTTAQIEDPFTGKRASPADLATLVSYPYYRYYAFNEMGYLNAATADGHVLGVYSPPGALHVDYYVLFGHGPDHVRSLTADGKTFVQQDILLNPNRFPELIYDPTNGAVSNGEILRAEGAIQGRAAASMQKIPR